MSVNQNPKNDPNLGNCQALAIVEEVRRLARRELGNGWEEMRCALLAEPEIILEVRFGGRKDFPWWESTALDILSGRSCVKKVERREGGVAGVCECPGLTCTEDLLYLPPLWTSDPSG